MWVVWVECGQCPAMSPSYLVLFVLIGYVSSLRILTKNMIRSSDFHEEPVEFLPVALKAREDLVPTVAVAAEPQATTTPMPTMTHEEDVEDEDPTTDYPEGRSTNEESEEDEDETLTEEQSNSTDVTPQNETAVTNDNFRGIGTDIWLVMTRAYECLWTGYTMDCFSSRVVPLFRSMMGYTPYINPYMIPRNYEETAKGHHHKKRRHLIPIVIGLLMIKFVVLPALGGIALATGKALLFSMLALGAAAFSSIHSGRYADKRLDQNVHQGTYYT